jgi:hypothetical protein
MNGAVVDTKMVRPEELPAGAQRLVNLNWTVPAVAAGDQTLTVCISYDPVTYEQNPANNCYSFTVTVANPGQGGSLNGCIARQLTSHYGTGATGYNFQATDITMPAVQWNPNQPLYANMTAYNAGKSASGDTKVQWYLSKCGW